MNMCVPDKPNRYVGLRYVPIISGEWSSTTAYEPLTIVTYQGNSYTSKTFVPVGVLPTDTQYWALTGAYNAQVEQYRTEVLSVKNDITNLTSNVDEIRMITIKNLIKSSNMFIAHQGAQIAPQNSEPAFALASGQGFKAIECDVFVTSDGVPVCSHNNEISDYVSGATGNITDTTYDNLMNFVRDKGNNIKKYPNLRYCTLRKCIQICKQNDLTLTLDAADSLSASAYIAMANVIKEEQFVEKTLINNKSVTVLNYFKSVIPQCITGIYQTKDFDIPLLVNTAVQNNIPVVGASYFNWTKENVDLAHSNGLYVNSFTYATISPKPQIDLGVDSVTVDNTWCWVNANTNVYPPGNDIIYGFYKTLPFSTKEAYERAVSGQFVWRNNKTPYKFPDDFVMHSWSRAILLKPFYIVPATQHLSYYVPAGYKYNFMEYDQTGTFLEESGWLTTGNRYTCKNTGTEYIIMGGATVKDGYLSVNDLDILDSGVRNVWNNS